MLDVHGEAVAGATFPVPIWHEYMAAALWHRPALRFALPNKYPTWHYLKRGIYGSFGYYSTPTYTTTTDRNHDDLTSGRTDQPGTDDGHAYDADAHDDGEAASSAPSDRRGGSDDDGSRRRPRPPRRRHLPLANPVAPSPPAR